MFTVKGVLHGAEGEVGAATGASPLGVPEVRWHPRALLKPLNLSMLLLVVPPAQYCSDAMHATPYLENPRNAHRGDSVESAFDTCVRRAPSRRRSESAGRQGQHNYYKSNGCCFRKI